MERKITEPKEEILNSTGEEIKKMLKKHESMISNSSENKSVDRHCRQDIVDAAEKSLHNVTITKKKDNQSRKEGLKQTISTES